MDATRSREPAAAAAPSVRAVAAAVGALVGRTGAHVDRLSLDLARDVGAVVRSGTALADAARTQWAQLARSAAQVRGHARGVPRVTQVVRAGLAIAAAARWTRLRAAAAGRDHLTVAEHRALAERTRDACCALRGGVLKLGQVASCRPDLIGPVWAEVLAALQDRVPALATEEITARVGAELAAPVDELFAHFAPAALAAASLAQVHAATLPDGTPVAVKVQVPGVDAVVHADIAALGILAGALGDLVPGDLATIAGELGRALATELDYQAEAAAGAEAALALAGTPLFVPAVIASHSTGRVLTTARVDGRRLGDALDAADAAERTRLIGALCDGVARQIFVGGVVHADPHPGNFLVTADGRIAVLDWGCVLRLTAAERAGYARLLVRLGAGDHAGAARELATLGFGGDPAVLVEVASAITAALAPGVAADSMDWDAHGRAMMTEVAARARAGGVVVPRSFVLLGRVLGTLAGLVARYRPALVLAQVIGPHLGAAVTA
ncbi:MAG: AarF/UbiB family protein [Kofleriaceae bacterium]